MFAVALCLAFLERGMSASVLIWRDGFASRALLDNRVAWMQEASQDLHMQRLGVQALLAHHVGPINQIGMEDNVSVLQNEIEVDQAQAPQGQVETATKGKRGAIHFLTKTFFWAAPVA